MTNKEIGEILSRNTNVGHGIIIEGDTKKIREALLIVFDKLLEKNKGHWVKDPKSLWDLGNCSECGYLFVGIRDANYCPNCGAKMEEADNEAN